MSSTSSKDNDNNSKNEATSHAKEEGSVASLIAQVKDIHLDDFDKENSKCLDRLRWIREQTAFKRISLADIVKADIVPRIVDLLLIAKDNEVRKECKSILHNIVSYSDDNYLLAINDKYITNYINALASGSEEVKEIAITLLGEIATKSNMLRGVILNEKTLPLILGAVNESHNITLRRSAITALSKCFKVKPNPNREIAEKVLPLVVININNPNDEVILKECLWIVNHISDGENLRIELVIESSAIPKIVENLSHKSDGIIIPALRTVGNIVTGNDRQSQTVIDAGALKYLAKLLHSSNESIVKEVLWTVSNITAGSRDQIQSVLDADIIPKAMEYLKSPNVSIAKEASWAISNLISGGTDEQIKQLMSLGVIRPFCDLLRTYDSNILRVILDGIENIVKLGRNTAEMKKYEAEIDECGGMDALDVLQDHPENDIAQSAARIFEIIGNDIYEGEIIKWEREDIMKNLGNHFRYACLQLKHVYVMLIDCDLISLFIYLHFV